MQPDHATPADRRRSNADIRILVVDDELGMRNACQKVLSAEGYMVELAEDGLAGLELFQKRGNFAVALIDLNMPRLSGIDLIQEIRKTDEDIVLLVITAYASIETAVEATRRGAYSYIPKPFTPDELLLPVRNGLEKRALTLEAKQLRQEREKQLLERALALKRLAEAKSIFVSLVAHEVKNPLAAIEGYLNMVLTGAGGTDAAQNRAMIERAMQRAATLRQMVAELMNLSAMETGNFAITRSPLNVSQVVVDVVRTYDEKARQKRVDLKADIRLPVESRVLADRGALKQVFSNLVDNAIKYTPEGGHVLVLAEARDNAVTVTVKDDGYGMDPSETGRIFEEFYRIRNEHTAAVAGTGLGLTVVKRLVDMHQGVVTVDSAPGKGSVFTVSLPPG